MSAHGPAGVVLTGGASRRMGLDKAFVVVDGAPMVVRVADALWEAGCHPVQCQGGDLDAIHALGLEGFADDEPGAGPVVAIRQALVRLDRPLVAAACDLPDLDAASVRTVIEAGRASGLAVATSEGFRHLLGYWSPSSVGALDDVIADGVQSYGDVLERLGATEVAVPAAALRNVNHPDEVT